MSNEEFERSKKEILDKIFLKEEETLEKLDKIVELARRHFKVEFDTSNIVFKSSNDYSIREKIILLLISRYLANNAGTINHDELDISEISKTLATRKTSLSKPLGIMLSEGKIKKNQIGKYSIVHHKILSLLEELEK